MNSFSRAIRRGHATIHETSIMGLIPLRRNGRGRLQRFDNGAPFKGTPTPLKGLSIPKGKPSATVNHRKKPRSIHGVFKFHKNTSHTRKGKMVIYPL